MSDPTIYVNEVSGTGPGWGTIAAKLEKQALRHAQPTLVLAMGAKKFTMPTNSTKTLRMRRAVPYSAATTALSEGVPPTATALDYVQVEMALQQYGAFTRVTDILVDLHTTPVLSDINQLNSEQAAKTKESLLWGMLQGATVTYWSGGASTVTVDESISVAIQHRAVRTLNGNKAKKFTSIVTGGVKQGTFPVEASYIAFAHTDLESDIRKMDGFVPVSRYGSQKPVHEMELGTVDSVRYVLSADLSPQLAAGADVADTGMISDASSKVDVYSVIFVGMDSYGCLNLAGKGVFTPVVVPVGQPSISDPLGQQGSVGWKMYSAEAILNSDWIVVVECGATD
jgi:N4-gp56 family major capsid protein